MSIENTGIVDVMKMKEADKVRNEVISDTYRVSGLTKGSVLTLDIGPVPTTQLNGPKKPCKYRSEIQVGTVMSYSWQTLAFPTFLPCTRHYSFIVILQERDEIFISSTQSSSKFRM